MLTFGHTIILTSGAVLERSNCKSFIKKVFNIIHIKSFKLVHIKLIHHDKGVHKYLCVIALPAAIQADIKKWAPSGIALNEDAKHRRVLFVSAKNSFKLCSCSICKLNFHSNLPPPCIEGYC